jgi:hypothetical protein
VQVELYASVHDPLKTKIRGLILGVPEPIPLDLPKLHSEKDPLLVSSLLGILQSRHIGTLVTLPLPGTEPLLLHHQHPFDLSRVQDALGRTRETSLFEPLEFQLEALDPKRDNLIYLHFSPRRHFLYHAEGKGIYLLNREFMFQLQGRRPLPVILPPSLDMRTKRQLTRYTLVLHANRSWDPVTGMSHEIEYDENYAKMFGLHADHLVSTHNRSTCDALGCHSDPDRVSLEMTSHRESCGDTLSSRALEVEYDTMRKRPHVWLSNASSLLSSSGKKTRPLSVPETHVKVEEDTNAGAREGEGGS